MLDIRSSSRRVARFISRPIRVRMNSAIGTRMRNMKVSCQLIQQAKATQPIARRGSATTLPKIVFWPFARISMSLVKRAISSWVPVSPKFCTSRWMARRKKRFRMSNCDRLTMLPTRDSCQNSKKPLRATAPMTSPSTRARVRNLSAGQNISMYFLNWRSRESSCCAAASRVCRLSISRAELRMR